MPVDSVNWPKSLIKVARRVLAVDCRNKYDITLIALNILQVLHKEWLQCIRPMRTISFRFWIVFEQVIRHLPNELSLGLVHSHNTKRAGRVLMHKLLCSIHYRLSLKSV